MRMRRRRRMTWMLVALLALLGGAWISAWQFTPARPVVNRIQAAKDEEPGQRAALLRLARDSDVRLQEVARLPMRRRGETVESRLRVLAVGEAASISEFAASLATDPEVCRVDTLTLRQRGEELVAEAQLTLTSPPRFEHVAAQSDLADSFGGPDWQELQLSRPILTSIYFERGTCVIDNRICRAGQWVGKWRIESVLPDVVVVRHGETVIELHPTPVSTFLPKGNSHVPA